MYSKWITIVVCFYSLAFIPIRFSRITFSSKTDAIHYRSSLIDNTIFIDDTPVITHPLFDNTPRITFYNSSESMRERIPVLMDSFAYYENKSLIVEAIFNLKYLTVSKEEKERIAKSHCIAWVGDKTANNTMDYDPDYHTIVTVFSFGEVDGSGISVTILNEYTNSRYITKPQIIREFTKERYYLSCCTSIANVAKDRVRMWLYYYYYQGVEHVTFFANEKYGYWKTVLHHFIAKGFLDVVDMEFVNHKDFYEQQVALQSCNRHYRYASRFVIYNDVDEFFIPIDSNNTIRSLVHRYDSIIPNALAFKV